MVVAVIGMGLLLLLTVFGSARLVGYMESDYEEE